MAEIDKLLNELVERGGSDLHLCSDRKPRMRESGDIVELNSPALSHDDCRRLIYEIIPPRNRREFETKNDTDFSYEIPDFVRFRVNTFLDRYGIGAVLRAIPAEVVTVEQLGLPESVTRLCYLSKGLVVVTGPTGCGKSTTLAAMIDLINRTRTDHIVTIEDPIEFVHKDRQCLINQREVHAHTESFAAALRAALREDPDIVLVGEMRDLETMEIALETAETGHLVFGTLHTNTAAATVDRIISAFPAARQNQIRIMLAASLRGVISQTLCKRKAGGRILALEFLLVDRAVASLIRDAKTHQIHSAMQVARGQGMILLNDSLLDLITRGLVDPMEAYINAVEKDDLLTKFRQHGIEVPEVSS